MKFIKLVDHGIANNFKEHIEINMNLTNPKYRDLYLAVYNHELDHDSKNFLGVFLSELKLCKYIPDLIKFCWENPSALYQLLPIYYYKKVWYFDRTKISLYLAIIIMLEVILLV